ncbi:retrovirus-related Pol polyprotein from type-2 retrotransposable element R2DM, partial [Nephila pilipes]
MSPLRGISAIEEKFREKFPELPVFQVNSSSSSDEVELLQKLDSPPSGPPSVPAFPKPLFSTVVRKGLFRCRFCEMPFASNSGLDSHILKIHGVPSSKPKSFTLFPAPSGRPTCRTCFHDIEPGLTMADHCRLVHNLQVTTNRQEPVSGILNINSTNSSRPAPRNVSAQKNNNLQVIIPIHKHKIGLRLHLFQQHNIRNISTQRKSSPSLPSSPNNEIPAPPRSTIQNKTQTPCRIFTNSHPETGPSNPPIQCMICDVSCRTQKGLRVHLQSIHKISVSKNGKNIQESSPVQNQNLVIPSPPGIPLPEECGYCNDPVSLLGNSIKYSFPLPQRLHCPIAGCGRPFQTQKWYTTNASLKKNIQIFHRLQISSVEFWCSICTKRISGKPSTHSCLKITDNSVIHPAIDPPSSWVCSICQFSAASKAGLDLHLRSHKKTDLATKGIPLVDLPTPKQRKKNKNNRITPLLNGEPGSMPLDRPLPSFNVQEDITIPPDPSSPIEDIQKIDLPPPPLLSSFLEPLSVLLHEEIDDKLSHLETLHNSIISSIQEHFHLLPPANRPDKPAYRKTVASDAQGVQKAYSWNRRKCIRDLINPNPTRCSIPASDLFSYFQNVWGAPVDDSCPYFSPPPALPAICESLDADLVCACLRSAENTAPGPDRIAYKHWREIDPSGKILTLIFNICLSLRKVPSSWKQSETILIHKKGSMDDIANWRPIALRNMIYKLFTKCLARKLADWCSANDCLSNSQKGFTPFDGVLEHNFVISQHLDDAHRLKRDSFACWVDISNAFGSVSHSVLWSTLHSMGADPDFILLVKDIYLDSSSSILTNNGKTAQVPILKGIKQGCPLSGILFDIAIDHVLKIIL